MKKVIAICNPSGGVGKTMLTINLAELFTSKNMKVLLIDLDLRGIASRFYLDRTTDAENDYRHVAYNTSNELIDIIPGRYCYVYAGKRTGPKFDSTNIDEIIQEHIGEYDVVICDVPSSLNEAMYWVFSIADKILIPAYSYSSLESIRILKEVLENIDEKSNPGIEMAIALTMFDPRIKLSQTLKGELNKEFEQYLLDTIIPVDANVQKAFFEGKSVLEYSPHTAASAAYSKLADEILEKWEWKPKPVERMISVHLQINENLVKSVDAKKEKLGLSRSATIRLLIEKGLGALECQNEA